MIKAIPSDPHPPLHHSDFSVIQEAPKSFSDVLAYYDHLRSYVEHEDDLINSRLSWSFTVHGFLFAIYGLLIGKIADLFVELHKTPDNPLPVFHAIAGLFALQVPIALFGGFIGFHATNAITASHNSIQHLLSIAHTGGILDIPPTRRTVTAPIDGGLQTITPDSMEDITNGSRVLVHDSDWEHKPVVVKEEVVTVYHTTGHSFDAVFRHPRGPGASLVPLGSGLLPKIVSGGGRRLHTDGARSYYSLLPLCTMWVWFALGMISLALAIFSIYARSEFFGIAGRL